MKTIKVLSTFFALMLLPFAANAVPQLQLDCDPCDYDPVTEDNVAESNVFAVAAILTPGPNTHNSNINVASDTFWMSIALGGLTDETGDFDAANAIFNSLWISLDGGTTYVAINTVAGITLEFGTPPSVDEGELPSHGYYDIYYIEINLNTLFGGFADTWGACDTYNTVDEGWVNDNVAGGSYCGIVYLNRINLDSTTVLHFDLYATDGEGFKRAAPYSHDVTSLPEPGTLSLLGLGLLALGLGRRRREIA